MSAGVRYLRIVVDGAEPTLDALTERLASALQGSGMTIAKPPSEHARGGFAVWIDCPADREDELAERLLRCGLRPVI